MAIEQQIPQSASNLTKISTPYKTTFPAGFYIFEADNITSTMRTSINAAIIAVAVVLFAFIMAAAYKYKYRAEEQIFVTGLAEKNFSSDLIVWTASYSRSASDLKGAYATLKSDENAIRRYLKGKGIADSSLVISAVDIMKNYSNQYDNNGRMTSSVFSGYTLTQNIKIESGEVDKVEDISRAITELIEDGIELNSQSPSYYYSKLSELKIDLLAEASEDAKARAQSIADHAGSKLGDLKKATMGVFQITAQNSNEDYSYGGTFNTTSKNKTASITLRTQYGVSN